MFAQEASKFDEVGAELAAAERAIGSPAESSNFFRATLTLSGAAVNDGAVLKTDLAGLKPAVREALGGATRLEVAFEPVAAKQVTLLHRTHPLIEGLATCVLNSALDPLLGGIARRAGVVRSKAVTTRTVLLLLRLCFHMKRKLALVKSSPATPAKSGARGLLTDVRELILATRQTVAQRINSALATLYWEIGRRIRQDVLKSKRGGYGEQMVAALGRQLEREFGRGYGEKNLRRMIQFATVFPDEKIVAALRRQLGRTHFKAIIPIADPLNRVTGGLGSAATDNLGAAPAGFVYGWQTSIRR